MPQPPPGSLPFHIKYGSTSGGGNGGSGSAVNDGAGAGPAAFRERAEAFLLRADSFSSQAANPALFTRDSIDYSPAAAAAAAGQDSGHGGRNPQQQQSGPLRFADARRAARSTTAEDGDGSLAGTNAAGRQAKWVGRWTGLVMQEAALIRPSSC